MLECTNKHIEKSFKLMRLTFTIFSRILCLKIISIKKFHITFNIGFAVRSDNTNLEARISSHYFFLIQVYYGGDAASVILHKIQKSCGKRLKVFVSDITTRTKVITLISRVGEKQ
jgi:hypothetical protein